MDKPIAGPSGGEAAPAPAVAPAPRLPGGRLGRTAIWLHALAWLFLGVGVWVSWRLLADPEESFTVLGVGGTAAVILFVWSTTLAARGLVRGEPSGRPVAVILVTTAELAAFFAGALWYYESRGWCYWPSHPGVYAWLDWCFEWCFPLWLPFLMLTFLTVAPYAWWRVRRAEKKGLAKGGKPWGRRKRWRCGLVLYGVFSVLLGFLLLPIPLVLYCGYTCRYEDMSDRRRDMARLMPVFVQREALALAERLPGHVDGRIRWQLIAYGMVRPELLVSLAWEGGPQDSPRAVLGLWRSFPELAQTVTDELIAEDPSKHSVALSRAGHWLGTNAPPETIRHYLGVPCRSVAFLTGFLVPLERRGLQEVLPDLESRARRPGPYRALFVEALSGMVCADEAERIWRGYLASEDFEERREAARCISILAQRHPETVAALALLYLGDADENVRLATLSALAERRIPAFGKVGQLGLVPHRHELSPPRLEALLKRLVRLLDDPSADVRCEATFLLGDFLGLNLRNPPKSVEGDVREMLRQEAQAILNAPPDAPRP